MLPVTARVIRRPTHLLPLKLNLSMHSVSDVSVVEVLPHLLPKPPCLYQCLYTNEYMREKFTKENLGLQLEIIRK